MAVEIPVVIDIEQAFQDAASRTSQAIKPLKQQIDEHVLEVPIEINKKGDLKEVLDFVGKTSLSMNDLKYAIKSATSELSRLKKAGASQQDIETYTKAIALLKGIRAEWQINERLASRVGDEELRNLQIQQQYNEALQLSALSINNINTKIASYTAMINNADIGSEKFEAAAIQLGRMSRQLQTVQTHVKILGTNTGSIDNLNAKIQLLNQQWTQMAASRKFTADGKLTAEAHSLLSDYKKLSAELKTQGVSMAELVAKEQQRIQKHQQYLANRKKENAILNTTVKTVDALQAKVNVLQSRLNRTDAGSAAFNKLNQQLRQTQRELANVQSRIANSTVEAERMDRVFERLLKRTAYFFGLHTITTFVRNVRGVTSEFELQRVALGGIIQDTEQANSLFRQIKAAAIESPFEIKDLISYTKQLSAYRVETENLFDVTMRLADVSAGLGVDMSRLILAYGQVRAAAVLRGQELRQFTEAGIPLVDLLAKKFQELNGRMVSSAEVFDLISKRAVPFEMISEIFEDITNKGGTFYKMQEKQAETLAGQWANLKDAVSIMYDEIGNTDAVHKAMERIISDAKSLMQNWRTVAALLKNVGVQFLVVKVASAFLPTLTYNTGLAEKATAALARAEQLETSQQAKSNVVRGLTIKQLKTYATYMNKAAVAQTLFGRVGNKLLASFLGGGWIGAAITAATVLVSWLISARQEATRLNKEIEKIGIDGASQINRSVSNFKRLADAAVEAAGGSNEQNEALEELKRTYGDIIPSQNLQIDKLRDLKGNYDSLTEAIKEKINMQILEQKVNATTDAYSKGIQKARKNTKNILLQYGLDKEQINAVMDEVQKAVDDGLIGVESTAFEKSTEFKNIIKKLTGIVVDFGNGFRDYEGTWHYVNDIHDKADKSLEKLADTYISLQESIGNVRREMSSEVGTMGVYAKSWENLQEKIKGVTVSEKEFGDKYTFEYKKERVRKQVALMSEALEEAFAETKIDISQAFDPKGFINFEFLNKAAEGTNKWGLTGYVKKIQDAYENVVPTNAMVGVVERKFQEIADAVGLSMNDVQGYLLRGEKSMQDYTKEIASDLEEAKLKVIDFQKRAEDFAEYPGVALPISDNDVKNANSMVQFLTILLEWLSEYKKQNKSPHASYTQDPFIKQMQNRIKFMQDFQKGYEDLSKYMSKAGALGKESDVMLTRGLSLGINAAEQQRAAEGLSQWYKDTIKQVFEKLKKEKSVTGTLQEFLSMQITGSTNRDKMLRDYQSLLQSLYDAQTDFDISKEKKKLEDALKKLSEEIKRSETARNFYKNILDLTGDEDLAATMSVSVYGGIGNEFKERMQEQLNGALASLKLDKGFTVTEEIEKAFRDMDFKKILDIKGLPEDVAKVIREAYESTQKYDADLIQNLLKTLEKAKSYGDKQVEIARRTAQRTAEINSLDVSSDTRQRLLEQNARKEAEDVAKLQYEAFKDSPMYIELFANLDTASSRMLRNMRDNIVALKGQWKDLDPTQLKELQSRLNELDEQLATRNPFKAIIDALREYRSLTKDQSRKEADEEAIRLTDFANTQKVLLESAKERYEATLNNKDATEEEIRDAKDNLDIQATITDLAIEQANKAQETANGYRKAAQQVATAAEKLKEWNKYVTDSLDGVREIVSTFASDDTADTFNIISEGIGTTLGGAATAGAATARLMAGDLTAIPALIKGTRDYIAGIFGTASALKIKNIDKQIKTQQDLLDELSYSYDRLDEAMEKSFGSDYIYNYNKQLEILTAQIAAYNEQARLEREKGKKADEDKIKDYEKSARDAQNQIADMRTRLSEFFSGTDLTSAAEDFASAWIEAYKEFGSTTDAMSEKFNDMIENMINKSLAAKIMQEMLQPIFRQIDIMAKDGLLSVDDIASIAALAQERIPLINDALTNLMTSLASAGLDVRNSTAGLKGISKEIAGASEESILALAAGINTQNFYMSYMPTISENVSAILAVMTGNASPTSAVATTENGDIIPSVQQMVYDHLPNVDNNISEMLRLFRSVITSKTSSTNTAYIAIR